MLKTFEFEIPSYGLFTVLGIVIALYFVYCRCEAFGKRPITVLTSGLALVVGMGVGSRLVFVLSQIPRAISLGSMSWLLHSLLGGGFVFYGGLYGAAAAVLVMAAIRKEPADDLMNFLIPGFPVFHLFGRVGCFLAGCCYGVPSSFGFVLPAVDDVTRLPVQLFEAGYNLIIVTVLMIYEARSRRAGKKYRLLPVYLLMYAPFRFVIEFFRGDSLRGSFGALSTSQWISLITIAAVAATFAVGAVKKKRIKPTTSEA